MPASPPGSHIIAIRLSADAYRTLGARAAAQGITVALAAGAVVAEALGVTDSPPPAPLGPPPGRPPRRLPPTADVAAQLRVELVGHRSRLGWTQRQTARYLYLSRSGYDALEKGLRVSALLPQLVARLRQARPEASFTTCARRGCPNIPPGRRRYCSGPCLRVAIGLPPDFDASVVDWHGPEIDAQIKRVLDAAQPA